MAGLPSSREGDPYWLFLAPTDPSEQLLRWSINWGDGLTSTISGAAHSAAHVYADDGSYQITATAYDENEMPVQVSQVVQLDRPVSQFATGPGTTGHFYTFTSQARSRADASAEASSLDGYLTSITNRSEQDFLDQFLRASTLAEGWIGLGFGGQLLRRRRTCC